MDITAICSELLQIIRRKKEYLIDMLNISQKQSLAIDVQDDDKLHTLIEDKQSRIDLIDNLDKSFLQRLDSLKTHFGVNSLDEIRSDIKELKVLKNEVGEIQLIINEIFSIEKENSIKIKKEYDDIKSKLKEINGGKKAVSAYGGQNVPTSGGIFFDNKK